MSATHRIKGLRFAYLSGMRNFLFIFSVLLFSVSWGLETKNKTQREALPRSNPALTGSSAVSTGGTVVATKPANESSLSLSLRATGYESQFSKADALLFKINYFLKYNINPSVYLKLNPVARLYSGHVQSVDGAESLANRLSVQHAAAYYQWMKESYVSMGIYDQYEVFSPLLVDDQMAFVGAQGKQSYSTGPWTFSLLGQTAIPNTQSSITNQNEKETTPMLNMVGVSSNWTPNETNFVHAKANYFKFSQLPTSVSTSSVVNGNTSADFRVSDTERAFKYDYYGIDTDLFFKRRVFKSIYILGGGSLLENQGAPDGKNQANRFGGGGGINIFPNQDLELSGYSYRIESDATVGAYGNTDYFVTNHMGYEIIASWKNVKQNYRISVYFNDGKLIVENPAQSDGKMYFLRFEVLNVSI